MSEPETGPDPLISPEIAEGISFGFIGLMGLMLVKETNEIKTLYKLKNSFIEINDNGKLFKDVYKKMTGSDLIDYGKGYEFGDMVPVNNVEVFDKIDTSFTEANKQMFQDFKTDFESSNIKNIDGFLEANPKYKNLNDIINNVVDADDISRLNKNIDSINKVMDIDKDLIPDLNRTTKVKNLNKLLENASVSSTILKKGAKISKSILKGTGKILNEVKMPAIFAAGITTVMQLGTTGKIDQEELALAVGGAVTAEIVEYGVKQGIGFVAEKSAMKVGTEVGKQVSKKAVAVAGSTAVKATVKAGVTKTAMVGAKVAGGVARAGAAAAKLAGKVVGGPVGAAFMVFDITNMALDIADVCGYNSNQIDKATLDTTREQYLESYQEAYNKYGVVYPLESKPDLTSEKNKNDLNFHFMDYIDKCNLILNKKVFDDAEQQKRKRKMQFMIVSTGQIVTTFLSMDNDSTMEEVLLLLSIFKKKKEDALQKQQEEITNSNTSMQSKKFYEKPLFKTIAIAGSIVIGGVVIISLLYYIFKETPVKKVVPEI